MAAAITKLLSQFLLKGACIREVHGVLAEEVYGCLAAEDVPDLPLPNYAADIVLMLTDANLA